jgi:preprotein translocase subunit SecG
VTRHENSEFYPIYFVITLLITFSESSGLITSNGDRNVMEKSTCVKVALLFTIIKSLLYYNISYHSELEF